MPYPSSTLYPSSLLFPGGDAVGPPPVEPPPIPLERVGTVWSVDWFTGYEGMSPIPDDLGCEWFVTNVDGWQGLPAPRVTSADRPLEDGTIDGRSTQPGRTITIEGTVRAPDIRLLHMAMDRASSLLTSGNRYSILTGAEMHMTRQIIVRRGAEALVKPQRTANPEAAFSFVLYGPDPRRLGFQMMTSTMLPSVAGGLAVPHGVPFEIASLVASGTCSLNNPGTATGPVKLRIDGPVTGPVVTHTTSGLSLVFAADMSLGVNEFLTVDMERHEVLGNGQEDAVRNNYVTRRGWSGFDPGQNEWAFAASSFNSATKLTVYVLPAW